MQPTNSASLQTRTDFKKTPTGKYRYWLTELTACDKLLREFRRRGTLIDDRYRGVTGKYKGIDSDHPRDGGFSLNLFHSNVITLLSMLYGSVPKVTVKRRHDDPSDDVGRVAALIMERLLNNDIQDNGKEFKCVMKSALQDRLLPGLGVSRVRYEHDIEAGTEEAPVDYFHWRDVAYGWGRQFSDLPWIGFRAWLTQDEVSSRFGEELAKNLEYQIQKTVEEKTEDSRDRDKDSAWNKAQIWEIWDKQTRKVYWVSPGYDKVIEEKDDPLGLSGFFPCPPFMIANVTTTLYVPVADYTLAQDLYNEIDILQARISIITEAVKVVGVYDRQAEDLERVFTEACENELIPVDNWAMFAEKGGLKGSIEWVPIKEIAETLQRLRELRDENIGLLQQVTGMSDIMRGELSDAYEGVGQSQMKAKFGSVRVQALQDEFAQFASDALQLKGEVIGNHFDAETIVKYANLEEIMEVDQELLPRAIELIKDPSRARLKVEIAPESIAMVDYAQLRVERTEFLSAVSNFMSAATPLMEVDPNAKPFLLQLLQWGLAGFKGSNQIEGVIDKAIEASEKQAEQPPQPDPEQMKLQGQQQLEQMKHQHQLATIQAKLQADLQVRAADQQADIATKMAESQSKIQEIIADMQAELAIISAKMNADVQVEAQTSEINMVQNAAQVEGEMMKDVLTAELDIDKKGRETAMKINEEREKSAMKIKEAKAAPKPSGGGDK